MKYQAINEKISTLTSRANDMSSPAKQTQVLQNALDIVSGVLKILDTNTDIAFNIEGAIENIISSNRFKNSKVENWFCVHPIYPDERVALEVYETNICQVKFYWLNDNSTKARISAGVMLTPNWEDRDSTQNSEYKVGIDFFLKKDAKSLLMVVSNRGNLRVMEFSDRLTRTQVEILDKLAGSLALGSQKAFHTALWDAFALSEVNKKFYEGVAKQFTLLCQHLIHNGKTEEDAKLFSSRLLGRLLFIWFLRKKKVIAYEDRYFPQEISDSTEYYESVLKQLFFKTFNTPIYDRKTTDKVTPYLNGGLFEPHDNDWQYEKLDFPPNYFQDLYGHLNKYNFTTDESSPDYEQVAIDPEMLGRVFESLLAEQRTDSGEQARKAKGAFYTPREIVGYMCKESLRQYLYEQLGDEKYQAGVDKLLDAPDYDWETAHSNARRDLWTFEDSKKIIPRVIGILDNLTVLDPACGSGAFPMGMLQLLTRTYERLDSRFDPYKTKLSIIQNTIFGVDIEPMAVEISRLRAWLAIIVDDQGEIDPLPNLDFKFVCADSLIPLEEQAGMFSDRYLAGKMTELRCKFFSARKPENKEKYKKEYYKLANSQSSMFADKREKQLRSFDPFKNQYPASFFSPKYMFGIDRFNIVIGNPPYVDYRKITNGYIKQRYEVAKHSKMINLYNYFFELGFDLLRADGILCYISPQQYLVFDNCKGVRDLIRKYCLVLLSDFSTAKVFEAGTYPFVTMVRKSQINDKAVYREYNQTTNLDDYLWQTDINNPIPEPVNISRYDGLLQKIETGHCLAEIVPDKSAIFVASSSTQKRLPLNASRYEFIEASNILEYRVKDIKSSIEFSNSYSNSSKIKQANKIIYTSRMTSKIRAVLVENQNLRYLGGKVNVIIPDTNGEIIVALLNSAVVNFWFKQKFGMTHMQGGALPINADELKKIPIPLMNGPEYEKVKQLASQVCITENNNAQTREELEQSICDWYGINEADREIVLRCL